MSEITVVQTWHAFAEHADGCDRCSPAAQSVRQGGEQHFELLWSRCCGEGQPLLEAWKAACDEHLAERPAGNVLPIGRAV